jgi:peptide/nickel transport system substrate-binding protein
VCLALACLALILALGPACTSRPAPQLTDTELTVGYGIGGTALSGALQTTLDSLYAEPLVSIGWNGRPVPKLAVGWTWSEGGRKLEIQLRQGVVFHDGTPVTAAAVVTDLRRTLGQSSNARVASISAEGENSIVIRLREPDAFLLAELSKASVKTGTDRSLGTGPFMLRSRQPEVVLESFPRYHLGQPAISKIIIKTYDTPRAGWAALMRGDVEYLHEVNRDAVDFVEAGSRIQTFSFPRPYYIPIIFNINHPILGRREVRQAINEAIDRGQIVKTALNDRGQPADGPIWPYHWSYNSGTNAYTYNPDAARLRLDGAGLKLMPAKGGEMPRRFQFTCLFWMEDVQFERIALVVQKQLFEIGIDVEMVPMTLRDLQGRLSSGDFDTILIPMVSGRSLEWTYLFWRSVPKGEPAIVRSAYYAADAALDRLRAAQSDDETRMAVADLQRVMYQDPPAAFLVRPETARAVTDSFAVPAEEEKGRDILGSVWHWTPVARRALASR